LALPNKATVPNNIANGDTADASVVMANFAALADAINLPWAPDQGYDDLAYTVTWTNGVPTAVTGARSGVTVYSATITYTLGLPTSVEETIGPSGSQVVQTTTYVYTNGVLTSTTVA
jgi:hypothetical protein